MSDRQRRFVDSRDPTRIINFKRFETSLHDVFSAYHDVLERPPDVGGCVGYAWSLLNGGATVESVRQEMLGSAEYLEKHPPEPTPPPPTPWYVSGANGAAVAIGAHAVGDTEGPKLYVGLSRFYWLWAWKNDRDRVLQEMANDRAVGYRYARVFAQVGNIGNDSYWNGRVIDPDWPLHLQYVVDMTRAAYDQGLQLLWTLIGKGGKMEMQPNRIDFVRRVSQVLREVRPGVLAREIMNEPAVMGRITKDELLELYHVAKEEDGVTLTGTGAVWTERGWNPPPDENFEGATAFSAGGWKETQREVGYVHLDRELGGSGEHPDRPWRQPWDVGLDLNDVCSRWVDNEPIGPGASVNTESRSGVLRSHRTVAFISRAFASCLHGDAGVRGYSRWEDSPGYTTAPMAVRYLPGNLPNGQMLNANANYADRPFDLPEEYLRAVSGQGIVRAYSCRVGETCYTVPFGAVSEFELVAARAMRVQCLMQERDDQLWEREVAPGERVRFAPADDYLLVSQNL